MSGLDSLAALAASQAQVLLSEVSLALDAATLALDAKVGDVLTATVLPPQNGSDFLLIAGQVIQAQLPPGINPGQTLRLQVTQVTADRIMVANLGVATPESPATHVGFPTGTGGLPPAVVREVIIAPTTPARSYEPPPPVVTVAAGDLPLVEQLTLEARMAAQATRGNLPPPPEDLALAQPPSGLPQAASAAPTLPPTVPPAGIPTTLAMVTQRFAAPLQIMTRGALPQEAVNVSALLEEVLAEPGPEGSLPVPTTGIADFAPGSIRQSAMPDSVAVRGGLPQVGAIPTAAAAVRMLAQSFIQLESALARFPGDAADATTGTLRSILGFIARMDPRNIRALPEQIAAFVSHSIEGPEPKLAALALRANSIDVPGLPASETPTSDVSSQAHMAERTIALSHDLKTVLAELIVRPGTAPAVVAAATATLNAITATQLGTVTANASNPSAIMLAIPLALANGTTVAHLQVSRDGNQSREPLDAENFHIGFVLDTQHLGTVAIDVKTVGRTVAIVVKTERESFAQHFSKTLTGLQDRLEMLRYRVASAAASVAARVVDIPKKPPSGPTPLLDVQA